MFCSVKDVGGQNGHTLRGVRNFKLSINGILMIPSNCLHLKINKGKSRYNILEK